MVQSLGREVRQVLSPAHHERRELMGLCQGFTRGTARSDDTSRRRGRRQTRRGAGCWRRLRRGGGSSASVDSLAVGSQHHLDGLQLATQSPLLRLVLRFPGAALALEVFQGLPELLRGLLFSLELGQRPVPVSAEVLHRRPRRWWIRWRGGPSLWPRALRAQTCLVEEGVVLLKNPAKTVDLGAEHLDEFLGPQHLGAFFLASVFQEREGPSLGLGGRWQPQSCVNRLEAHRVQVSHGHGHTADQESIFVAAAQGLGGMAVDLPRRLPELFLFLLQKHPLGGRRRQCGLRLCELGAKVPDFAGAAQGAGLRGRGRVEGLI
mmetsp:Transcript_25823/g.75280  ORF Transcript_25823/g.75280 Transcript_25823/m.75280 type:complete len:320 (-) Transcript_25823:1499-2458(-)